MNIRLFLIAASAILSFGPIHADLARGADISWLSEMEASGRKFYTSDGTEKDLLEILKGYCIDAVRLRVWVNPTNGWSGKQDVVNLAKRAHSKGFKLMIDFHYSDSWADPGQQTPPATWTNFTVSQLEQAVSNHTKDVLNALKQEGISPDWIQIGNETNNGMLWPLGQASTNMANYAKFVQSGNQAAKSVFPNAKTIVHVANGFDNGLFKWNIGGLLQNGASFDVIGMSLYPEANSWDSLLNLAKQNMLDMESRYHKPIMVSEIGLGVGYQTESRSFIEKMILTVQSLPNHQGLGVFWWEPEAYDWRGYTKVAWLNNGRPSSAMNGFKTGCPTPPPPPPPPDTGDSHHNPVELKLNKDSFYIQNIPRLPKFDLKGRKQF